MRINVKDVKSLLYEVINKGIKSLAAEEEIPFTKKEGLKRLNSEPLAITYKRFVAPKAKKVTVYIEREYNRSKREYVNTVYVDVDNKPELFLPSIFIDTVCSNI